MPKRKIGTDDAYRLTSPDDSRRLYAEWAESYDSGFASEQDYRLPDETAQAFVDAGGSGPVLDVGAGTGLCAQVLARLGAGPIDATDISAEMLDQARGKDIYRALFQADLTAGLPNGTGPYNGIVSSGTFTTGHVGPDAIDTLLTVARPGALFAISISAAHYEAAGFAAKFDRLGAAIRDLTLKDVPIYGPKGTGDHKDDRAFVALFYKV